MIYFYYNISGSKIKAFVFSEVLEDLGSSGTLIGTISTYPGISPMLR